MEEEERGRWNVCPLLLVYPAKPPDYRWTAQERTALLVTSERACLKEACAWWYKAWKCCAIIRIAGGMRINLIEEWEREVEKRIELAEKMR